MYFKLHKEIEPGGKKIMLKNFTKGILAAGSFMIFVMGNTPVYASTKNESDLKFPISFENAAYQDEESFLKIVENAFEVDLNDLKIVDTMSSKIKMESEEYYVEANGIDLTKTGLQHVSLTLKKKPKTNAYALELPIMVNSLSETERAVSKNMVVEVKDVVTPVIMAQDQYVVDQGVEFDLKSQIKASDDIDKEVEVSLQGSVDPDTIGTYEVIAKASDESGNTTSKTITVQVEENFYDKIANAALAQLGVYQDCTMLVTNSLKAVGIDFHGAPVAYLSLGTITNDPVPGDIIVYQGHVAIYIGNGQAVHGGWLTNQTVISTVECDKPFVAYVHVSK